MTATYGSAMPSIAANLPAKTGYTFGGYYKNEAGAGNQYYNASGASARNSDFTAAGSLYAKWTQTVTLNANTANHGTGADGSATATFNGTALSGITHTTPATNYTLKGYYTAATGGTKVLNANGTFAAASVADYITSSKWTKAGATTLYAQYEENVGGDCNKIFWFANSADATTAGVTNNTTTFGGVTTGSSSVSGSMTIDGTTYTVTGRGSNNNTAITFTVPADKTATFMAWHPPLEVLLVH